MDRSTPNGGSVTAPMGDLGWYIRLISAASSSIAGRLPSLGEIQIGADEEALRALLAQHRMSGFAGLSVERCVYWGALYLFLAAQAARSPAPGIMLDEPMTPAQLEWVRKGADFWGGRKVLGAAEAYFSFRDALLAAGAIVSPVENQEAVPPPYRLEAESMLPILGRNRLRVRLVSQDTEANTDACAVVVTVHTPTRTDIHPRIEDAPGASVTDNSVELSSGGDWTEIVFQLEGPVEDDVPIEMISTSTDPTVVPARLQDEFPVRQRVTSHATREHSETEGST